MACGVRSIAYFARMIRLALFLLPVLLLCGCQSLQQLPPQRPNIILIIADDIAWDDVGPEGNPFVRAPNIKRLAKEGMWADRAFLTIASCSPSRSSIITGRFPHNTNAEQLHWPLPLTPTFVDNLRRVGYWTGAAGKWHLGEPIKAHFDDVRETTGKFEIPSGATSGYGKSAEGKLASGAEDWLPILRERPRNQPFFLWLASLDAHRPYEDNIIDVPHRHEDVRLPPYILDTPEIRAEYAQYYDEINRFDSYVGDVLHELEAQGIDDNTLVIFISDNGRPFPRDKITLYDSGIKTPFYARWPAVIKPGSKTSSVISSVDLAATFLELGRGKPIHGHEGHSLVPILQNPKATVREFAFAEKHWHDYDDQVRAVTNGRFKYIRNYYTDVPNTPSADGVRSPVYQAMQEKWKAGELPPHQQQTFLVPRPAEEFYDCIVDPHETINLAGSPGVEPLMNDFRAALEAWQQETHDSRPSTRTADEFDRHTGTATPARVRPRASKGEMIESGHFTP